jgi:lipoyl-dependent peroxiredoxin
MAAQRTAHVTWQGDLMTGSGRIDSVGSGAISGLDVTWASRTEESESGRTSPEELIAAAHAACFSMAFSGKLAKNGTPATKLDIKCVVSFDKGDAGWGISKSELTVRGTVPGIDQAKFAELADAAKDGCPVSQALKGNVALAVNATLND